MHLKGSFILDEDIVFVVELMFKSNSKKVKLDIFNIMPKYKTSKMKF